MSQNNSTWQMYNSRNHRLVWADKQPERMNPEFKKEWVAGLRSREYEQGVGRLCNIPSEFSEDKRIKYCCLGVAGDLKVKSNPEKYSWIQHHVDDLYKTLSVLNDDKQPETDSNLLPAAAARDMGLGVRPDAVDGILAQWTVKGGTYVNTVTLSLASLNDDGFTFDQITDLIEYFL